MKQPEGWVPRGHTICNGIADRHFLMFDMSPWCLILSRVSVTCLSWVGRHSVIFNYKNYKLVFKKIDAHGLAWHLRRDFHVSIFLIPLKSHFPGDCLIFSRVLIILLRGSPFVAKETASWSCKVASSTRHGGFSSHQTYSHVGIQATNKGGLT